MNLAFKKCVVQDLDMLTEISRTTFIDAFEKDNKPLDFNNYMDAAFSKETIKAELLNPNSSFYFTYLNQELAGYFKLNKAEAQNEILDQSSIELERIYVLNKFQGLGIGKRMLNEIIAISKVKQLHYLWLGVWELNANAIRFYERHGFKKFGKHPYYIGKDKQTDWLMKLQLI